MLIARSTPESLLRLILGILTAAAMSGCVVEEKSSQASFADGAAGGTDTGGSTTATGSFSLSWTAPVTRSDGSPMSLAEINGYKVYYGSNEGDYPNSIDINDGATTTTTVSEVPVGDYYVVMTTYDSDGRESTQSGVVSKQAL
jgi:hypothetical protein